MYPERPVNAPIVEDGPEAGKVIATSVTVILEIEKTAYSVAEYAKHTRSSLMKVIILGECGNGYS
jgi:hypothetical protein